MVMNIHSDASYLSKPKARSRACGHFFMGWMPTDGAPIKLNGAFHVSTTILRFVVASAAKAELERRRGANFSYQPLLGDRKPPLDYRK
jgi:hypothetical protein